MPSGPRPQPPVGTVRVALTGTNFGHRWAMVFYLQMTDDGTHTVNDLDTIATGITNAWNTNVRAELDANCILTQAKLVWITSAGNQLTDIHTVSIAGSGNSPLQDASAAYVIDWPISAYYRGGHPRSYLAGVETSTITNGSAVSGAKQTSLATALGGFRNAINALTATHISVVTMGTVSFQTGGAWRVPPVFRQYTGVGVRPTLGTQRRRILH